MEIKTVPITDLITDPNNARTHDQKNLDAIKGSIAKFSQVEPLIVQKGTNIVIGGNGRLEAMKDLGHREVAVHYVELNNTEAAALGIALNRTGELASWNEETLGSLLQGIREDGFEIGEIGFELEDLVKLDVEDSFNNELDINEDSNTDKKFILEIEFPDEQARKNQYELLSSQGLIVRFK